MALSIRRSITIKKFLRMNEIKWMKMNMTLSQTFIIKEILEILALTIWKWLDNVSETF